MTAVGIGITTAEQATWAASALRVTDMASANYQTPELLSGLVCIKQLKFTEDAAPATVIAVAQANGITQLGYHPEGMTVAELVTALETVYPLCQAAGMTMLFVPNATRLETGYTYFDTLSDGVLYATQKYQSTGDYPAAPAQYVRDFYTHAPTWPVDIQISLNPPLDEGRETSQVLWDHFVLRDITPAITINRWWFFFDSDRWTDAQALYQAVIDGDSGMGIRTNSYGDTTEIASLVPRYANGSGIFDTTTRPTLLQVESFVDQVSGMLNSMLSQVGFTVPVSQADVKLALDMFVNDETAAIAEGVNGSGRFGPTAKQPGGKWRFALILDDVKSFVEANSVGFQRLGAARGYYAASGLGYREKDEAGEAVAPLFERKGYGDETIEWDEA